MRLDLYGLIRSDNRESPVSTAHLPKIRAIDIRTLNSRFSQTGTQGSLIPFSRFIGFKYVGERLNLLSIAHERSIEYLPFVVIE